MAVSKLSLASVRNGFAKSNTFWDQTTFAPVFDSIKTIVVGSSNVTTITFSGIPQSYQHLQIRGISRSTIAGSRSGVLHQFNGDSGNNYVTHGLYGDGTAAGVYSLTSTNIGGGNVNAASGALANEFGASIVDILDYTSVNKYKTVRCFSGVENNSDGQIRFASGLWLNTAAITSIVIQDFNGGNLVQYSQFALYGIKGA